LPLSVEKARLVNESAADSSLFPERFVPEEMHGLIEAEHMARYRWAAACAPGRRVLDAGCGVGYGSLLLHEARAESVIGVDIAPDAIEAANKRAGHVARFLVGDMVALPFEDASFDLVVCFEAIEHVRDQHGALDEMRRVLGPNGVLIMSSPNRDVYQAGNPHHTHEYMPDELYASLATRFANVELARQHAWLASLVCSDEMLREANPDSLLRVELHKIAGVVPGLETFTLGIAGDGELPELGAVAMITNLDELEAWRQRARSAEEHLERLRGERVDADATYESIKAAYESVREDYSNAVGALERGEQARERQQRHLQRVNALLAERNAALRLASEEQAQLRARASELDAELGAHRGSLAEVHQSLSWRITAPLRLLGHVRRRS
jgi:O-antigen biosynthesis protein